MPIVCVSCSCRHGLLAFSTAAWMSSRRDQNFYNRRKLKSVRSACEAFYAGIFCGGNVAQARGFMLPQKTDERIDLAQFQVEISSLPLLSQYVVVVASKVLLLLLLLRLILVAGCCCWCSWWWYSMCCQVCFRTFLPSTYSISTFASAGLPYRFVVCPGRWAHAVRAPWTFGRKKPNIAIYQ